MPGARGDSLDRSPYNIDSCHFVERFAFSSERRIIVEGFLEYRNLLYLQSITEGFQWIDGSFLEDVEALEMRNPRDVDVVTFFRLPKGKTQEDLADDLHPDAIKMRYHVDGYYVELADMVEWRVRQTVYWYSMWSHRRDNRWKGFIQIPLNRETDRIAKTLLAESNGGDDGEQ